MSNNDDVMALFEAHLEREAEFEGWPDGTIDMIEDAEYECECVECLVSR